jgi:hypothetical protein
MKLLHEGTKRRRPVGVDDVRLLDRDDLRSNLFDVAEHHLASVTEEVVDPLAISKFMDGVAHQVRPAQDDGPEEAGSGIETKSGDGCWGHR